MDTTREKYDGAHDLSEFRRRIEELEQRIREYQLEEKQWNGRELQMLELIKERKKEITLLKSLLHQVYRSDN